MKIKFIPYLLLLALSLATTNVFAYPNFIGYGYTSCTVCHYNAYGNGPLTDYGRALGASTISDDRWWLGTRNLNDLGEKSGFLYSKHQSKRFRPSLDYRGMLLKNNLGGETSENEWINMDANASLVVRLGPETDLDKFFITGTLGYAPVPRNGSDPDADTYRSREYYVGYRPSKNWGIYLGLMDKVYGIRIANHEAYSRSITGNTMNDQTHALLVHYSNESFDLGIQPYVGNMAEDEGVRQKGFAANFEYSVNNKFRPGASVQVGESEFLKTYAYAFHARAGFGKGNSVMGEMGQVQKTQLKREVEITSRYWMVQTHTLLSKGFFLLNTIEYLKSNIDIENKNLKWGPGIQYFVIQGVELRFDVFNSRLYSESSNSEDSWDFTGQVHLWF